MCNETFSSELLRPDDDTADDTSGTMLDLSVRLTGAKKNKKKTKLHHVIKWQSNTTFDETYTTTECTKVPSREATKNMRTRNSKKKQYNYV